MQTNNITSKMNATIDIVKLIMAILVVGIHTEPFGFNIWLDRGFGIITRLCVPFFFIASSYFFWRKEKSLTIYLMRLTSIYVIWSLIYLPFDFSGLKNTSFFNIVSRYLWYGNEHALWYLCGSIIGMLLTYALYIALSRKHKLVFFISILFLFVGCLLSTYAPLFYKILSVKEYTVFNFRNGLFYAFPYIAMGLIIAKNESAKKISNIRLIAGLIISMSFLMVESVLFVIFFNTASTILWMSVLPASYFLFMLIKNSNIQLRKDITIFIRKLSTLIYLCHGLFILLFNQMQTIQCFFVVLLCSIVLSVIIITLSKIKYFRWLQYIY
ncbi:MAG: acyltransferase family protein [Clostridia bacterium]|nr:acyltransferase family protein [Clostridia bacterium]